MAPEMTPAVYEGPAIVEIMGHRRLAGVVSEVDFAGVKLLRVDVPSEPPATQFYGGSAIFCVTPCTEATMLEAVAAVRIPEPVHRWELPRAAEPMRPGSYNPLLLEDGDDGEDNTVATCRVCGCTEDDSCVPTCHWVPDPENKGDLCSACFEDMALNGLVNPAEHPPVPIVQSIEDVPALADHLAAALDETPF